MKIANALKDGIAGAGTLGLLKEALHKLDGPAKSTSLPGQTNLLKKLKKGGGKKGVKSTKLYIQLASQLVSNAALFGLSGLAKKKHVILRGGLLGTAAGLGVAFLQKAKKKEDGSDEMSAYSHTSIAAVPANEDLKKKLITVALYTAGGLLAGIAVKKMAGKKGKGGSKQKRKKSS